MPSEGLGIVLLHLIRTCLVDISGRPFFFLRETKEALILGRSDVLGRAERSGGRINYNRSVLYVK